MLNASLEGLPPSPAPAREGVVVSSAGPPGATVAPGGQVSGASVTDAPRPIASDAKGVVQAIAQANEVLRSLSQAIEFQYDRAARVTVIRLVDKNDGQVLRQIPSQEMLEISQALERMQSALVHGEA